MATKLADPGDSNRARREREADDFWRYSKGSGRLLRYASLLYSGFFFITPYYQHSLVHWLWFALFYVAFLAIFFLVLATRGRMQQVLLGLYFLLGFVYFPFNSSAAGAFVYPVVMVAFIARRTRTFLAVLIMQVGCVFLETWWLHLSRWPSFMGIFFTVVIGLSNLSYARQQRATFLLRRANDEIEHLAQVAERERIGRDLHDLLGHTLTLIAVKSELAIRISPQDPERALQEMVEVEQTARKALAEVREAVLGYRSPGLASEIASARRALASAHIQSTASTAPVAFSPEQEIVLCLALREAVTNIVRHAQATVCTIQLESGASHLRFSVQDNGLGGTLREGNGLRGMRERVRTLAGTMSVSQAAGGGTHIAISLPLQQVQTGTDPRQMEKVALA